MKSLDEDGLPGSKARGCLTSGSDLGALGPLTTLLLRTPGQKETQWVALDFKILPFLERGAKPGNPARRVLLPLDETITPYLKARQQRPTSDFSGTVTCTVSQRHLCSSPTSVKDAAATRPYFCPRSKDKPTKPSASTKNYSQGRKNALFPPTCRSVLRDAAGRAGLSRGALSSSGGSRLSSRARSVHI